MPDIQLSEIVGSVKNSFWVRPAVAEEGAAEDSNPPADAEDDEDLPTLSAKKFTYTYSGALKQRAGGGLDLIFFEIGGSVEQTSLQTIAFTLCRTLNRHNCVE